MDNNILAGIEKYLKAKTAIIGVGNMFKGDDQLGPSLIRKLEGKTGACLFDCGEVPENYIQPIIKVNPQTLIVVDASDWKGEAGDVRLIKQEEIGNFGFSTHNASLGIFLDYLKKELPSINIIIIGVQIAQRGLMQPLSPRVETTLDELARFFIGR